MRLVIAFCIIFFPLISQCQYETNCDSVWTFIFFKYAESYEMLNENDQTPKLSDCRNDTLLGIRIILERIKQRYLEKDYTASLVTELFKSTDLNELKKLRNTPRGSDSYLVGIPSSPEVIYEIYFINALFLKNITFQERVLLGYKNSNEIFEIGFNNDFNNRILKKAMRSVIRWSRELSEKGEQYMRENKIGPLHYSNLEWK